MQLIICNWLPYHTLPLIFKETRWVNGIRKKGETARTIKTDSHRLSVLLCETVNLHLLAAETAHSIYSTHYAVIIVIIAPSLTNFLGVTEW